MAQLSAKKSFGRELIDDWNDAVSIHFQQWKCMRLSRWSLKCSKTSDSCPSLLVCTHMPIHRMQKGIQSIVGRGVCACVAATCFDFSIQTHRMRWTKIYRFPIFGNVTKRPSFHADDWRFSQRNNKLYCCQNRLLLLLFRLPIACLIHSALQAAQQNVQCVLGCTQQHPFKIRSTKPKRYRNSESNPPFTCTLSKRECGK